MLAFNFVSSFHPLRKEADESFLPSVVWAFFSLTIAELFEVSERNDAQRCAQLLSFGEYV